MSRVTMPQSCVTKRQPHASMMLIRLKSQSAAYSSRPKSFAQKKGMCPGFSEEGSSLWQSQTAFLQRNKLTASKSGRSIIKRYEEMKVALKPAKGSKSDLLTQVSAQRRFARADLSLTDRPHHTSDYSTI